MNGAKYAVDVANLENSFASRTRSKSLRRPHPYKTFTAISTAEPRATREQRSQGRGPKPDSSDSDSDLEDLFATLMAAAPNGRVLDIISGGDPKMLLAAHPRLEPLAREAGWPSREYWGGRTRDTDPTAAKAANPQDDDQQTPENVVVQNPPQFGYPERPVFLGELQELFAGRRRAQAAEVGDTETESVSSASSDESSESAEEEEAESALEPTPMTPRSVSAQEHAGKDYESDDEDEEFVDALDGNEIVDAGNGNEIDVYNTEVAMDSDDEDDMSEGEPSVSVPTAEAEPKSSVTSEDEQNDQVLWFDAEDDEATVLSLPEEVAAALARIQDDNTAQAEAEIAEAAALAADLKNPRYLSVSAGPHAKYYLRSDGKVDRSSWTSQSRLASLSGTKPIQGTMSPTKKGTRYVQVATSNIDGGKGSTWLIRSDGVACRSGGRGVIHQEFRPQGWRPDAPEPLATASPAPSTAFSFLAPTAPSRTAAALSVHYIQVAVLDDSVFLLRSDGKVDRFLGVYRPVFSRTVAPKDFNDPDAPVRYTQVSGGPEKTSVYLLRSDGKMDRLKFFGSAEHRLSMLSSGLARVWSHMDRANTVTPRPLGKATVATLKIRQDAGSLRYERVCPGDDAVYLVRSDGAVDRTQLLGHQQSTQTMMPTVKMLRNDVRYTKVVAARTSVKEHVFKGASKSTSGSRGQLGDSPGPSRRIEYAEKLRQAPTQLYLLRSDGTVVRSHGFGFVTQEIVPQVAGTQYVDVAAAEDGAYLTRSDGVVVRTYWKKPLTGGDAGREELQTGSKAELAPAPAGSGDFRELTGNWLDY